MSLHKSLKGNSGLIRHRNVLTRTERLDRLEKEKRWNDEEESIFGIPKVLSIKVGGKKKKAKKEEKAAEEAAAAEAKGNGA
ncbi:MAG: small basic protein [Planctomycetes bacterium]|nr:small basic protein [Planctomycetota bacterium]